MNNHNNNSTPFAAPTSAPTLGLLMFAHPPPQTKERDKVRKGKLKKIYIKERESDQVLKKKIQCTHPLSFTVTLSAPVYERLLLFLSFCVPSHTQRPYKNTFRIIWVFIICFFSYFSPGFCTPPFCPCWPKKCTHIHTKGCSSLQSLVLFSI